MKPPNHHKRIDLVEMKAEIVKKLGPERSKRYFLYLSRFLNLKLRKVEFNKLCIRIVGRENLPLHNHFIRSIVKNACNAKAPPPKEALKPVSKRSEPNKSLLSNGDIQKVPLKLYNSKFLNYSNLDIRFENGDLSRNQARHHQVLANELENEGDVPKRLQDEVLFSEDDRKAYDGNPAKSDFCAANSFNIGGLLDSSALIERMKKIALMQGIKGVTLDCASLLNKGLDSYLKGLISSGVLLTGTRLGGDSTESYTNKHQDNLKLINGVIQENKPFCPVSLLDFKVAMELNPQQLGEDWPLLLEKICTQAFCEE